MATTPVEPLLFVDTNIWLYATDPDSRFHTPTLKTLDLVQDNGSRLAPSPQILRKRLAGRCNLA